MPAPQGIDLTWLTQFVRDQITQNQLSPQAATRAASHTVDALTVNSSVVLAGVKQPKITTSPLALGPPPAPNDGDIWLATAVDANGTRLQFQYDISDHANPWKFVGGKPATVRGGVTSAGAVNFGTGFSASRTGVGAYNVTYTVAFASRPIVVAQHDDTAAVWASLLLTSSSTTGFTILSRDVGNAPTDGSFEFIAIQQ